MAKINQVAVDAKISRAFAENGVRKNFTKTANRKTLNAVKQFLEIDFDNDPVNRQLIAADNGGEYGAELYGYLGFEAGSEPVDKVKEQLRNQITLDSNGRSVGGRARGVAIYEYDINFPDENEIDADLPWTSLSWIDAIQYGIGNVEHFLFKNGKGRSTHGIQVKGNVNSTDEQIEPDYWTRLAIKFQERLRTRF